MKTSIRKFLLYAPMYIGFATLFHYSNILWANKELPLNITVWIASFASTWAIYMRLKPRIIKEETTT